MERKRARTVLSKQTYEAIGKAAKASRPKAWTPLSVEFVQKGTERMLEFFFPAKAAGHVTLSLPVAWIDELKGARLVDLRSARLSPSHTGVIVDGVDAFISVEGLFKDFLAERSPAMRALMIHSFAATGGKTTSEAKKRSSAENGRKGGRPPTKKQEEHALARGTAKA